MFTKRILRQFVMNLFVNTYFLFIIYIMFKITNRALSFLFCLEVD